MYKFLTTAKRCDDLSIGFHRDRIRRQREMTKNNKIKGKIHIRIYSKDIFGSAEHQEKACYGLGYKSTLTKIKDDAILNKDNATNIGKLKINAIECYVWHYTPSNSQHNILMNQIVNRTPTEFQYVERSVFVKEVKTQNLWSFELGTQEGTNMPIWIIIGFQKR